MIKAPCRNCKERYLGCHEDCQLYILYKDEKEKENAARRKALEDERIFTQKVRRKLLK